MINNKFKKKAYGGYFSYLKILSMLMKKGKKTTASVILSKALYRISGLFKKPVGFILKALFFEIRTLTELKHVKSRKKVLSIPFVITRKRRLYLAVKWLIMGCKSNKQKISFFKKMILEMFLILKRNLLSRALQTRLLTQNETILHSSNFHYRW
jgi:ribosomal protein S7